MARREISCRLEVDRRTALATSEAAIEALGWDAESTDSALVGHEDSARLCCHDSPVRVTITVARSGPEASVLNIEAAVPGFGPIASRSLSSRLRAIEAKILGLAGEPESAARHSGRS